MPPARVLSRLVVHTGCCYGFAVLSICRLFAGHVALHCHICSAEAGQGCCKLMLPSMNACRVLMKNTCRIRQCQVCFQANGVSQFWGSAWPRIESCWLSKKFVCAASARMSDLWHCLWIIWWAINIKDCDSVKRIRNTTAGCCSLTPIQQQCASCRCVFLLVQCCVRAEIELRMTNPRHQIMEVLFVVAYHLIAALDWKFWADVILATARSFRAHSSDHLHQPTVGAFVPWPPFQSHYHIPEVGFEQHVSLHGFVSMCRL